MKFTDPAYGVFEIADKVLVDVIKTSPMQRLKGLNQYGSWQFILPNLKTSRFEHSLGVCFLLKRMNASLEEQLAGLLHDVSHTAFSHVIDYIYGQEGIQEHHELFFKQLIMNSEIPKIAQKNGIKPQILMDMGLFPLLEKPIPDLCADRLDYFFRDSVLLGVSKEGDIKDFMQHIAVKDNEIVVDDADVARKIAVSFMECSKKLWASPTQAASYQILADTIKSALEAKIISEKDFLLTDQELYNKLKSSSNLDVTSKLNILSPGFFAVHNPNDYDFFVKTKARYINPKVLQAGRLSRLSEIDKDYKKRMTEFVAKVSGGYCVKIFRG